MTNNLPITSGMWRGRKLQTPAGMHTRPTLTRVRQAIFNKLRTPSMCGSDWSQLRVLDICAGSGALGFEALSNGARHLICIENDRPTAQTILNNAKILQCGDKLEMIQKPFERVYLPQQFGLIFADPPFEKPELIDYIIATAPKLLATGGVLVLQLPINHPTQLPHNEYKDYGISRIYYNQNIKYVSNYQMPISIY